MNALLCDVPAFILVLIGALATTRRLHHHAVAVTGVAALFCALVLAVTEAKWSMGPTAWLFTVSALLAALSYCLRIQRDGAVHDLSTVR